MAGKYREFRFKRNRAISCSSSATCYSSHTVSRPSGLVEGGARGIKILLILIAVESQDQGCPGRSETSGWLVPADVPHSQTHARRALPKAPDCALKGRAWHLLVHQPVLCPGCWVLVPMGALQEPAARVGERKKFSLHATWAFLLDQELSPCMGSPLG